MNAEPRLKTLKHGSRFEDFAKAAADWRKDAAIDPANITLFYFAGHGAQRTNRSHVLLLQDFGVGAAVFGKGVDTSSLLKGMLPGGEFPRLALRQLYFIDACRVRPRYVLKYDTTDAGALWDGPGSDYDDRAITLYFAVTAGRTAYSRKGEQTIFSSALLDCLTGKVTEAVREPDSSETDWHILVHSLSRPLQGRVELLSSAIKKVQRCSLERMGEDVILNRLDGPPMICCKIGVEPEHASDCAHLLVANNVDEPVMPPVKAPIRPHPFPAPLPAGLYQVRATIRPPTAPFVDRRRLFRVAPNQSRKLTVPVT
jgi:hypothetical protein